MRAAILVLLAAPLWAVDFASDIHPILAARCLSCHSGKTPQAGFSLESRASALKARGELLARVKGEAGMIMPPSGAPLSEKEIAAFDAWIKADMPWTEVGRKSASAWVAPLEPRDPALPTSREAHPVDRFVDAYFRAKGVAWRAPVADSVFARRAYLDLWGLTPSPEQLQRFRGDRAGLVNELLADRDMVSGHWISFWSDLLRDDLRAYHGGEKSIRPWLLKALKENKAYDQMVRELVNPVGADSPEGFLLGINWRGDVNASQRPFMQAAQNTAQVFLGVNLKCASCHDSFINQYKLQQSYGMAALFSDEPKLELYRCDNQTGKFTGPEFLFPAVGAAIPEGARLADRRAAAAALFTSQKNGRLARTFVNRIWARLFGRGIVEPVDDMDAEPWNADLLDWLAADFARHNYDIHHLLRQIMTSKAWQQPAEANQTSTFRGPVPRRLTAEQFVDTLSAITGEWRVAQTDKEARFVREWELRSSELTRALGRPLRDQVITTRNTESSTLQALELVNGATIHQYLRRGALRLQGKLPAAPAALFDSSGLRRSGEKMVDVELKGAQELWLLIEDIGSYDPERTMAIWADLTLEGPHGSKPLVEIETISQFAKPRPGVIHPKMGTLAMFSIGPGWTRLKGKLVLDESGKQSDINGAVRGYIFPRQPDRNLLAPVTGVAPVPVRTLRHPVEDLFLQTLGRRPNAAEKRLAQGAELEDLLWVLLNHPEFQYVN